MTPHLRRVLEVLVGDPQAMNELADLLTVTDGTNGTNGAPDLSFGFELVAPGDGDPGTHYDGGVAYTGAAVGVSAAYYVGDLLNPFVWDGIFWTTGDEQKSGIGVYDTGDEDIWYVARTDAGFQMYKVLHTDTTAIIAVGDPVLCVPGAVRMRMTVDTGGTEATWEYTVDNGTTWHLIVTKSDFTELEGYWAVFASGVNDHLYIARMTTTFPEEV